MAAKKQYADISFYEDKLPRIMERLGVDKYEYDWTRQTAYVQFFYKNRWYRFDHSVEKANASGKMKLVYGTDVFAQIILALEDLARMIERGIYDLEVWISGMQYLPVHESLPQCFQRLGYTGNNIPDKADLTARYKNMLKKHHPDNGGSTEGFLQLQQDMKDCMDYIEKSK